MTDNESFSYMVGLIICSIVLGNYFSATAGWLTLGVGIMTGAMVSAALRHLGPKRSEDDD